MHSLPAPRGQQCLRRADDLETATSQQTTPTQAEPRMQHTVATCPPDKEPHVRSPRSEPREGIVCSERAPTHRVRTVRRRTSMPKTRPPSAQQAVPQSTTHQKCCRWGATAHRNLAVGCVARGLSPGQRQHRFSVVSETIYHRTTGDVKPGPGRVRICAHAARAM